MKKKILAAAVLSSIGVVAHAQSSVTLYGIIDAGISYANHSTLGGASGSHSVTKFDDGVAQASRWGIRGTEDLGGGLKALFLLENGFNVGNGTLGQGSREFGRQAFVGLSQNGVGSLTLGRQYSFSTDFLSAFSTGVQTVAGNYAYHINDFDQLTSSRIDNSVKFTSANFAGLTFGALYGFSNQAGAFAGSTAASRTYSFGLNYAAGPLAVGAAYTDIRFPSSTLYPTNTTIANVTTATLAGGGATAAVKDLRTFGAGARYLFGPATFWALYTNTRFVPLTGTQTEIDTYEAGAKYAVTTALTAGLGYTYMNIGGGNANNVKGHWNQVDASVDYSLSKRTDVYLLGIYQIASGHVGTAGLQAAIGSNQSSYFNTSGTQADSQLAFRVGIRHRF
jgi:predicted porin